MRGYEDLKTFANHYPVEVCKDCSIDGQGSAAMWHEFVEIKLFHTEGTQLVIGNQVYISEIDSVYVINSCVPHSTQDSGYNRYDRIYIDMARVISESSHCATRAMEALSTGELVFRTHIKNNKVVNQRIRELVAGYTGEAEDRLRTMGHLYLLLDELIRTESVAAEQNLNVKHVQELSNKLSPAFSWINQHFTEQLTIPLLAQACNLSEKYFCVLFRQRTGSSCITYINRLRIEKAKMLLLTTDQNMASISEACGFSDPGYFARQFKKQEGCAPMDFRKRKRL